MTTKKKIYNFPKGYSLFGGLLKAKELSKDLLGFISKSMEKFGPTYAANIGISRKVILTKDPDFINHILVKNQRNYRRSKIFSERATQFYGEGFLFIDGEPWKKQRRLLQPSFHRKKISNLFKSVLATIDSFLATFPTGANIDIYPLVHELSFEMLVNSLFDMELSAARKKELKEIYHHIEVFTYNDINQPFGKLLYPINGKEKKAFAQSKRLRAILLDIIKERKASTADFDDLLDMLLNSRYEDTGETMPNEKVIDELIVLIQAGHDTTATTLAWALYLIGTHPKVQQQLVDSIAKHDSANDLQNNYLIATIHETMRLYPTSWLVERTAIEDDAFGAFNYPEGTMIVGFYYGLHRDKDLWENALSFQPERFVNDPKLANTKKFLPFGAGPRKCIGSHFAMAEMAFCISAVVKKFDFIATGQVPIIKPMAVLRPDKIVLTINKRTESRDHFIKREEIIN